MTRPYGRAPRGRRLVAAVPHGALGERIPLLGLHAVLRSRRRPTFYGNSPDLFSSRKRNRSLVPAAILWHRAAASEGEAYHGDQGQWWRPAACTQLPHSDPRRVQRRLRAEHAGEEP